MRKMKFVLSASGFFGTLYRFSTAKLDFVPTSILFIPATRNYIATKMAS